MFTCALVVPTNTMSSAKHKVCKIYEINILGYENIDQSFIYNSFESDLLKIILKNCITFQNKMCTLT